MHAICTHMETMPGLVAGVGGPRVLSDIVFTAILDGAPPERRAAGREAPRDRSAG